MANPTTAFGWVMPTTTDLVTDLPADFAVFGQGVDTSMQYLLGGTTGQVLSKTSATNMAFTWTTPTDQVPLTTKGDLFTFTTVDARLGVGTNGQVLTADSAQATGLSWTTAAAAAAGTLTGATLASNVTASSLTSFGTSPALTTPTISTLTTNGDLVYGTGSGVLARKAIGSTGQVLTVAAGIPSWATPSAGKIIQVVTGTTSTITSIATTTMTDTTITATITPTLNTSTILVLISAMADSSRTNTSIAVGAKLYRGATLVADYSTVGFSLISIGGATSVGIRGNYAINAKDSPASTSALTYKLQAAPSSTTNSGACIFQSDGPSTITLIEVGA